MSFIFGNGKFPCANCKRDTTKRTPCISCSVCGDWYHHPCTTQTDEEFEKDYYFFCSPPCELFVQPFSTCTSKTLVKHEIFVENECGTREPFEERTNNVRPKKTTHDFVRSKLTYNPFIDIKCAYLVPKDLDSNFLNETVPSLSIFHNNIRSANKNLTDVEEIFRNCNKLPDIIALSETKLNDKSVQPHIEGYKFDNVDSPTAAGGVGIFVANHIEYFVRNDLSLKTNGCEDIWIEIKANGKMSKAKNSKSLVIGVIYRHPSSQYAKFLENLENNLNSLGRKNT